MRINRHHHSPASALPERDLDRMIERLADAVDPVEFREAELAERVDELLDVARRLFGAAGVGLMLVDEREQLGLVSASSEAARALERAPAADGCRSRSAEHPDPAGRGHGGSGRRSAVAAAQRELGGT